MDKASIIFKEELTYITNQSVKDIVLKCFKELAPDYFWTFFASSSHKYHPKVSNKEHGIVLHTKLCVWWGRQLLEALECNNTTSRDIIVASLLLHDLQKFGKVLDSENKPTLIEHTSCHGPLLSIQIEKLFNNKTSNMNESVKVFIDSIITCVALHMGIWTNESLAYKWRKELSEENKKLVDIVHLADCIASKKVDDKLEELDNYIFPEVLKNN
jgi:hypothetical protein